MKTEIDLRDDAAELRMAAPVVRDAREADSAAPPVQRIVGQPVSRPARVRAATIRPEQETFMAAVIAAVTRGLWTSG